jgi:hypothetical protein
MRATRAPGEHVVVELEGQLALEDVIGRVDRAPVICNPAGLQLPDVSALARAYDLPFRAEEVDSRA